MEMPEFSESDHQTWGKLFERQEKLRREQIVEMFDEGIKALGFTADRIPDLEKVNKILADETGWKAVYVKGLEEADSFYPMIARKEFPIGHFIRDSKDLSYTPEPDVFHDLYGHIPFYMNHDYARACEAFGQKSINFLEDNQPARLRQFERFFWFTYEFGLVETPKGRRIFGGGIASSFAECAFALSDKPEVLDFDIDAIRKQEFDISHIQERLFVMKDTQQLYDCIDELYEHILNDPNPEESIPEVEASS
jgi:phenylalanine-4-hydroxylase